LGGFARGQEMNYKREPRNLSLQGSLYFSPDGFY
jgi:hypothetical protein